MYDPFGRERSQRRAKRLHMSEVNKPIKIKWTIGKFQPTRGIEKTTGRLVSRSRTTTTRAFLLFPLLGGNFFIPHESQLDIPPSLPNVVYSLRTLPFFLHHTHTHTHLVAFFSFFRFFPLSTVTPTLDIMQTINQDWEFYSLSRINFGMEKGCPRTFFIDRNRRWWLSAVVILSLLLVGLFFNLFVCLFCGWGKGLMCFVYAAVLFCSALRSLACF